MTTELKKLFNILREKYKYQTVIIISLMVVGMTLETMSIGIIIPLIDIISSDETSQKYINFINKLGFLSINNKTELLVMVTWCIMIFFTIKMIALSLINFIQIRFVNKFCAETSLNLFKKYLYQDHEFHMGHSSGILIKNIFQESGILARGTLNFTLLLMTELFVLIGITMLLMYLEPLLTITLLILFISLSLIFNFFINKKTLSIGKDRQFFDGERMKKLQQSFGAIKEAKLMNRENEFINQYHHGNLNSARSEMLISFLTSLPRLFLEWFGIISIITLIFILTYQNTNFQDTLIVLGIFAAAAFKLIPSIARIVSNYQGFRYTMPVINTIHNDLKLKDPKLPQRKKINLFNKRKLRLIDVTYTYPTAEKISLKKINLEISFGSVVGIVGASGAGKSTLVDLILGVLKPHTGEILIDNDNIFENIRGWQDKVGYVPQKTYLLDETIKKNIAFGLSENKINEENVKEACNFAKLDELVASLKKGLNTEIGEEGIRLSGGQKQRISIARALYNKPEVIILDEATNSLDEKTENQILNDVISSKGNKTIIIISHQSNSLSKCDKIIKIHNGEIIS